MKHDKDVFNPLNNEEGYVLIGVLFIMLLMIIIGMAGISDTSLELQIASNDRTHRETFYQADGTTQVAARLVEESVGAAGAFTQLDTDNILVDPDTPNNTILIVDNTIWDNTAGRDYTNVDDANRDFAYYPGGYDPTDTSPHSNVIVDGVTSTVAGAGLQQLAGYEGKGKGTAGGGGQILYTIYSQYKGNNQSESIIEVKWRHVIGLELEGRY